MWCEVVCWEGVRDHPQVLQQLMRSENFDASSSLAEDEVSLLEEIHEKISTGVQQRIGEWEYEAILREILDTPGQVFTEADVMCRYNLAKVIGKIHVDFIIQFCTVWVDFKTITVVNTSIQALTRLPA